MEETSYPIHKSRSLNNSEKRPENEGNKEDVPRRNPAKRKRKSRFDKAPPGVHPSSRSSQEAQTEKKLKAEKAIESFEKDSSTSKLEKALLYATQYAEASVTSSDSNNLEVILPIPDKLLEDTSLNFVGLFIGPGGMTQKKLQQDLHCRINIQAEGKQNITKDTCRGLHFLITASTKPRLDVAVAYLNQLITDPIAREALRRDQSKTSGDSINPIIQTKIPDEMMMVPADKVGMVIGKGGETVLDAMRKSGAVIRVEREHNPTHPTEREVQFQGTPEQIKSAKEIISSLIADHSYRSDGQLEYEDYMEVPQNLIGIIIGKSGDTIKTIKRETNCSVQIVTQGDPNDMNAPKICKLRGTSAEIQAARMNITTLTNRYKTTPEAMNRPIGSEVEIIAIPVKTVGTLLGKGGESVKKLAALTGTRVQILPPNEQAEPGFDSIQYKKVSIRGDRECIDRAKSEIQNLIDILEAISNPKEIVNPHSATTPEEQALLMQKYLSQQSTQLPEWAQGSYLTHTNASGYNGMPSIPQSYNSDPFVNQLYTQQLFSQQNVMMGYPQSGVVAQGQNGINSAVPQNHSNFPPAPPPGAPPGFNGK